MAALRDVVRDFQEDLRGGIAWVVFWREGTSWDGQSVYLDDDGLLTKDDRVALTEILQKDAHAVALNSYYSGQVTEDMTVDELTVGVRHHYRRGSNSLAVFFEEHKNLMQDLYDKISEEQSQYKDWLMKQPPNVILDHSYDYSIREEILASVEDEEHKLCDSQVNALLSVPDTLAYTAEEDMNDYEFKVVWALSELSNVKWWHRNISRLGFQINGPVHAYPDIIVMLHSGKVLMVETKGDHLDNDESKEKAKIGDQWAKLAGKQYKYYMVFETKQPSYPGAYSLERFMEIVKEL